MSPPNIDEINEIVDGLRTVYTAFPQDSIECAVIERAGIKLLELLVFYRFLNTTIENQTIQ